MDLEHNHDAPDGGQEGSLNFKTKDQDSSVVNVICEFLEVAVHLILYVREIYPSGIFKKCRKYNISVMMGCHPELSEYILEVVNAIRTVLSKGEVEKVVIQISSKDDEPLERFVFELKLLRNFQSNVKTAFDIEAYWRSLLLKLNTCDAMLTPLPEGCTFSIFVYTQDCAALEMEKTAEFQIIILLKSSERHMAVFAIDKVRNESDWSIFSWLVHPEFPWLRADTSDKSLVMDAPLLIPVKSCDTGMFRIQCFVEESKAKDKLHQQNGT